VPAPGLASRRGTCHAAFKWVCLNLWAGQALGTDDQDDQARVGNNNRTETCRSCVRDHPTTGDAIRGILHGRDPDKRSHGWTMLTDLARTDSVDSPTPFARTLQLSRMPLRSAGVTDKPRGRSMG
jgi:hypothetical protein